MPRQLIGLTLTGMTVLTAAATVSAQTVGIVPDNSLGNENSIVTPDGVNGDRITGGATRGGNLFHSFNGLSIGPNQTAWFDNSAAITSILVRVTGGQLATIDGTVRANGTADLFILNPNGITFGPNAKLNIGGALSALTTPAIPLGEQGLFSAVAPDQSQLLAVKPSASFDLARFQPQTDITFNANWALQGQALNFVGQNIAIGGSITNAAPAPATVLTLRSSNNIRFNQAQINNPTGQDLYQAAPNLAPIGLVLQADADRSGQGDITIQAANLGLYGGIFQATAPGTITVDNSRFLSTNTAAQPAAAITFQGGKVELKRSAVTVPTSDNLSQPGSINNPAIFDIRSANSILIDSTRINQPPQDRSLSPATFDPAKASQRSNLSPLQITFTTPQDITIQNSAIATRGAAFQAIIPGIFALTSAQIYSDNFMAQNAAPITIQAKDIRVETYVLPPGQSKQVGNDIGISSNSVVAGQAATLNLTATNDITFKGTGIGSNTITDQNAGNIILTAGNKFEINNGGMGNQSIANTAVNKSNQIRGNNGQIIITAKLIELDRFGINMENFSQGGNGKISLNATENITIGEGGIGSNAKGSGVGADIIVNAGQKLTMKPRSGLNTLAEKQSKGGNIRITANQFTLQGGVSTTSSGDRQAGDINITAAQIILDEGLFNKKIERGTISTYTGTPKEEKNVKAFGKAGDIILNGIGSDAEIILKSGAGIANTSFDNSQGNTGNIILNSSTLQIQKGSQVVIATNGSGSTGSISVDAAKLIRLTGTSADGKAPSSILSAIRAKTTDVNSNDINIKTSRLEVTQGAGIIASTLGNGNSGNIDIDAGTVVLDGTGIQVGGNERLTSGILTSVGISNLPSAGGARLIQEERAFGVVVATLRPITSPGSSNAQAKGNSGNIRLQVGDLDLIQDAQLITVILGSGKAGDITIDQTQGNIRLRDRAAIRADSDSGQGGSIKVNSDGVLLLRRNSEISAVSRASGKDGNITITVPFIVGRSHENSDIFAVSKAALNGGRSVGNGVTINAENILGFEYRNQFTDQNDIIATGDVTLNLPDIDPSRGLTVLPIAPIDIAQKIDRRCNPNVDDQSSAFTTLGSGGLPANPSHAIVPNGLSRLATLPDDYRASQPASANPISSMPVEAQQSLRLANGTIQLRSSPRPIFASTPQSGCLHTPD
jgi:filamentous hemagglutinin family protein